MKKVLVVLLLPAFILLANSCTESSAKPIAKTAKISLGKLEKVNGAINFYVIGDWGKSGNPVQSQVAKTMTSLTDSIEPDFIVTTGDNFYEDGVASVNDPLWRLSWTTVYKGPLMIIPWYVVLGNHDYRGNVQAELDYAKISREWRLPSRYYYKDVKLGNGQTMRMIFIDSDPFIKAYYKETKYKSLWPQAADTSRQKAWLDTVLGNSKARWNIVFGHHPFYSGEKGYEDLPFLRYSLGPIFKKHHVDAYFCGHVHDLQHIKTNDFNTEFFISGGGAEAKKIPSVPGTLFHADTPGFMIVSVNNNQITVQTIGKEGQILDQYTWKKGA